MATRPVFTTTNEAPFYKEVSTNFTYFNGFSITQKRKCIESLHESFLEKQKNTKVLEISSKSPLKLGVNLSAFNLRTKEGYTVESAFQGSKVFENAGPFPHVLTKNSREAKRSTEYFKLCKIIGFNYLGEIFGNEPKTYFYNWLYVNALHAQPDLSKQILEFDAFTDIEFNPQKSINCQAQAAAIYVSLYKNNLLKEALESKEKFLKIVYSMGEDKNQCVAKFENYKLHNSKYNNVYLFGYDITEADDRSEVLTWFQKQYSKDSLTQVNRENLYQFLSKPIQLLKNHIPLSEIDCVIYPDSARCNLVQSMIEILTASKINAKWTGISAVKKMPEEIKFDFDKFLAKFPPNNASKKQYDKEYVDKLNSLNELARKIKDCGYFSIADEVPVRYRKFISNFLCFENKEQAKTLENISVKKILIVDDISTSGATITELLKIINTLNSNCEIFIFTLFGKTPQI